jgi:hypothetical protein
VRRRVREAWEPEASVADALNGALGEGTRRFVDHAELNAGEAYEAFIHRTGRVPTRDNLHDLFNGIVWLRFPALKRRLNALQAAQIAQHGVQPMRGAVRDALTLFDENGAWWPAPAALRDALRQRDWASLFVARRPDWTPPVLFGHALLEKLEHPRKAITAHVWDGPGDDADSLLAALTPDTLAAKPFLPLPVLGVPGWWPANESGGFYADPVVFRPPRG